MSNLVSVIIPCCNEERYIERSVRSVISQGYAPIELVVVDDGSADNSRDVVLRLQAELGTADKAIKYIYKENGGLGSAIDTGLKHINGAYLALLDADDRFLPNAIAEMTAFLDAHPDYAGVRASGYRVNGETRTLFATTAAEKTETDIFPLLVEGVINNWAGTYMLRTDRLFAFYPQKSIYPSRCGQNLQLLMPCAYGGKFGFIDKPLMEYISRGSSLSVGDTEKLLKNADGYYDIRLNTLNLIFPDKGAEEYLRFKNLAELSYRRQRLDIAYTANDKKLQKAEYKKLSALCPTKDDRANYYKHRSACFRLILKLKRVIKRQ